MASINASTSGPGGIITSGDTSGNLSLQSGGTTVVALTSAGAAVTGTLSATGAANLSSTLAVTGAANLSNTLTVTGAITATGGIVQGATAAPAFSANLPGSTTISLSAYVKVPFSSEEIDTNNNYDPTTNYRFTPTVAGYYQITLMMIGSASATAVLPIIYKNGAAQTPGTVGVGVSGVASGAMASGLISMNGTTDYVEAYVYQTGNGALSHSVGGCNFSGFLARSA